MAKLWAIIKREYLERVWTKFFVVSTLFAPLLFGAITFGQIWLIKRASQAANVGRVVVIDATGSELGTRVASALNGGAMGDSAQVRVVKVTPEGIAPAESAATREVMQRRAKGYLVLDAKSLAGTEARYAGTNATAAFDISVLQRAVRNEVMALRLQAAGVDPLQAASLARMRLDLKTERLTTRGRGESGTVSTISAFTVAFLLYMSIFLYGQNVLRGVMEEKQTRVAEVVISSVPATRLLAGKVLGVGAVGLTQQALWLLGSWLIVKARGPLLERMNLPNASLPLPSVTPGQIALLVTFFLLGYVFYASLFAAVGAMVSNEQDAQQVQLPIALLLVATALCIQPVILAPEGRLARVLSLLPFSAPIAVPLRLTLMQLPATEIAASLACLLLGCAIAVYLAARIYRTGLLMYGKRPTLREVARWVRHG
jgi:ABC-2 type transport system permease protein